MQNVPPDVKATDVLANERTFLAYIRTALAFIAFGFVIARFGLFVEQLGQVTHVHMSSPHYSAVFGVIMAVAGIIIALLGAWRYTAMDTSLRGGVVKALPRATSYVVTIVIAAIGLLVAIFIGTYY
jgi:putative membrane protein